MVEGYFEAKTGKILSQKYTMHEGVETTARGECFREPEWGEDYIDEQCMKEYLNNSDAYIKSNYGMDLNRSVYRQCEELPGN
jgi:hypothetical protein